VGLAAWTAGWCLLVSVPAGMVAMGAPLTGLGILLSLTEGEPAVEAPAKERATMRVVDGRPVVVGE
jgi:hypothetical protein